MSDPANDTRFNVALRILDQKHIATGQKLARRRYGLVQDAAGIVAEIQDDPRGFVAFNLSQVVAQFANRPCLEARDACDRHSDSA